MDWCNEMIPLIKGIENQVCRYLWKMICEEKIKYKEEINSAVIRKINKIVKECRGNRTINFNKEQEKSIRQLEGIKRKIQRK